MFNQNDITIGGMRITAADTPLLLPCHWPGISSCPSITAGWIGGRVPDRRPGSNHDRRDR
jgi:hypothetical protein